MSELTTNKGLPIIGEGDPADPGKDIPALGNAIDILPLSVADTIQPGVISPTDWSFNTTVNAGTGELSAVASTGGVCWHEHAVLGMIRTVKALGPLAILPGGLPTAGNQLIVGIELKPNKLNASPTIVAVSGSSAAIAETAAKMWALHPAAKTAGNVRIRDILIKNTGGVFSVVAERDRRPWARGAHLIAQQGPLLTLSGARQEVTGPTARLEFSGKWPLLATVTGFLNGGTGEMTPTLVLTEDGSLTGESIFTSIPGVKFLDGVAIAGNNRASFVYRFSLIPAVPGSALLVLMASTNGSGQKLESCKVTYQELVGGSNNNGIS